MAKHDKIALPTLTTLVFYFMVEIINMRYAIFTDIHANLEALQTVLSKIDELATEKPIDQIWFLGDLVGYGPNPNECIDLLRERTDVIIAGNHDWAAVGKLDVEDFSPAARISAEWTGEQLTEDHREFLRNLPERLEKDSCTLVHGSPYGPLWEYLTSEVLAERAFEHFNTRFCIVGHTHVPVIFQQPIKPTLDEEIPTTEKLDNPPEEDTSEMAAVVITSQMAEAAERAYKEADELERSGHVELEVDEFAITKEASNGHSERSEGEAEVAEIMALKGQSPENEIQHAEDRLNSEIEELLELLGLSQSMIQVTNEMLEPTEGLWEPPTDHRAIINPGGVGQPRDGDPRAAFMIYDSEKSTFEFFRVEYPFAETQEKIIKAGLPQYLAVRLGYGR
jgi:diadenosine tetraphosphatase ApaH/serine/threonine PP2A family protein phosphatase